jgi:beta-mannosidase
MAGMQRLDDGWTFKESGNVSIEDWLPAAQVPGTIHTDLQHSGIIPDPLIDINELSTRWVAERSWTYRTTFTSPEGPSNAITDLVFEGLDTFATVRLNGNIILSADNMFLEYRTNITEHLVPSGSNELEIEFASALLRGRELLKEHEHEHRFIAHQTEASRLPVRKAQYHWGWDWGPIILTAGIWRPVYLETHLARVEDVWYEGHLSDDLCSISGTLHANVAIADGYTSGSVHFSLSLEDEVVFDYEAHSDGSGNSACAFRLREPHLWHPAGYGHQTRYKLKASVYAPNSEKVLATKTKLIGFRRVQLIQDPDQWGKSFYFRINNVDIFSGGSCWIPASSFLPDTTPKQYRDWIRLLVEGNQIMVRVWGGGIYESSDFYSACDEFGVLAWQDFAMACQSTPTYPSFLKSLEAEAKYNVSRLRMHPSLVIWCGNNEDWQIQEKYNLEYEFDGDKDPQSWLKSTFPARYIYEHLLPEIVQQMSPGTIYHPSSPWGDGKATADPSVGDIHQWDIWHGKMMRYQQAESLTGR